MTHLFTDGDGREHECTLVGRAIMPRFMLVRDVAGHVRTVHETKIKEKKTDEPETRTECCPQCGRAVLP